MRNRQHFQLTSRLCVVAALSLLISQGIIAQVTIGSVTAAPDLTQSIPGDCASYNSVLSTTGVSINGQAHPNRCRATVFTPLFDGMPLGASMQAFLNSSSHPPLFTIHITRQKGFQFCATVSKLTVTLSGSLQATRLQWTGAPVIGAKCTNEGLRVNAVSSPSSPAITPYVQGILSRVLQAAQRELIAAPAPDACGPTSRAASLALDQQIWNRLQLIASQEIQRFEVVVAPNMDVSASCAAKCNLCFPGWVGTIQCTATVNDPSYQWNEVQTWDVGGGRSTTAGNTVYPAEFTASGNGSKLNGPSWTISASTTASFRDAGVNANKRFSTSNDTIANGITWSSGQTNSEGEMQLKVNADQVGGNSATNDPTATVPSCINTQQRPPTIPCSVSCTWNLLNQ